VLDSATLSELMNVLPGTEKVVAAAAGAFAVPGVGVVKKMRALPGSFASKRP
jgi:hypothetical protein